MNKPDWLLIASDNLHQAIRNRLIASCEHQFEEKCLRCGISKQYWESNGGKVAFDAWQRQFVEHAKKNLSFL